MLKGLGISSLPHLSALATFVPGNELPGFWVAVGTGIIHDSTASASYKFWH